MSASSAVAFFGVAALLYYLYQRALCKPLPGIPYNKDSANTLLGDIPGLVGAVMKKQSPFEWTVSNNIKLNSPIIQIFVRPLAPPWVIIADFNEAQDILLRRYKEFDRSPAISDAFGGITPDFHFSFPSDERFKAHRNLLKDLMTPAFLHHVAAPRIYATVSHLVRLWSLKGNHANGHPFNANDDTFNILLDAITTVTFGLDTEGSVTAAQARHVDGMAEPDVMWEDNGTVEFKAMPKLPTYEALSLLIQSISGAIRSPVPRLTHWCVRQTPSYRAASRVKEAMIDTQIEKGIARFKAGDITERCALDNILQRETNLAEKAGRLPEYYSRAVKDELLGFLLAGYDTTASTMTWGYKFMTANQHVQTKLRSHLHKAFPRALEEKRDPTAEEITRSSIPYLEATIEEIHRYARIFGVTLRIATIDTTVLGHHIPKGTETALTMIGPSFQKKPFSIPDNLRSESYRASKSHTEWWDPADVDIFKPERWLKVDEKGGEYFDANAGPILAFAMGPRGCFGKRLAYLQMRMMLILVLWNLELQEIGGELGTFEPVEKVARQPNHFYLKVKAVER